jgi:transposase
MTRRVFTVDFRREAVRLTQTSGRTINQVADDLGIGRSTLTRWKRDYHEAELLSGPHDDVEKELARLRKENELLRQERDLLKRRQPPMVTFTVFEGHRDSIRPIWNSVN